MKNIKNMQGSKITIRLFAISLLAITLTGCHKEQFEHEYGGRAVAFRSSSYWQNSLTTRTAYSGEVTSNVERIDWVNGDKIRIWSDKAATKEGDHDVDYAVSSYKTGDNKQKSEAQITSTDAANGLLWDDAGGTHAFYCLYPSPALFTGTGAKEGGLNFSSNSTASSTVNMTLPRNQSFQAPAAGDTLLKPDMDYAYMYAATAAAQTPTGVKLVFKPMFTAFQFTVDSGEQPSLTLTSFVLESAGKQISGSCTATVTASDGKAVFGGFTASPSAEQKRINVDFSGFTGGGLTIKKDTAITFTVFALPQEKYDDLSVTFTTNSGDKKTLALKYNDDGVIFEACHKYNIKGIGVPGEWVYEVSTIDPIELSYLGTLSNQAAENANPTTSLPNPASYTPQTLKSGFVSYRYKYLPESEGSSTYTRQQKQKVSYKIQFSRDGSTWSDNAGFGGTMDSLKIYSPGNFEGSIDGEELTFDLMEQVFSTNGTLVLPDATEEQKDLATYNVATGKKVARSTANCYVVDASGEGFKFPAVYGNAILHGQVNTSAFFRQGAVEDGYPNNYLEWYLDHADEPIKQPYIVKQPSVKSALDGGDELEAILVWENVHNLIENVRIESTTTYAADSVAYAENLYILFDVPGTAHQGNAMVALRLKNSKTIVWSWHIWCYKDKESYSTGSRPNPLKNPLPTPTGYKLAPVNLGWCDFSDYFKQRKGYLRVVQEGREPGAPVQVWQKEQNVQFGMQPYYVHGRKDPIRGFAKLTNANHELFYHEDYAGLVDATYGLIVTSSRMTVGQSIQNPFMFVRTGNQDWCVRPGEYQYSGYNNLWNSAYLGQTQSSNTSGIEVTKTIYDPCPVGYKVPSHAAFGEFIPPTPLIKVNNQPAFNVEEGLGYGNLWRYYNGGTVGDSSDDIFFPAAGFRNSNTSLSNVGSLGYYWCASAKNDTYKSDTQLGCVFNFGNQNEGVLQNQQKANGRSIRPAVDPQANL